ncbi:MAG: hypothetical protein IKE91_02010 [Clostridia bacterium]|nr:hypothetical protein [Clostridia bacterium]
MNTKVNKVLKFFIEIFFIITIVFFAWSMTPKTFQNDTFYTIKIGEVIQNTTQDVKDLLPWNKGLDMKDHFSYHNLPYTYPHWLYDFLTFKIYSVYGFNGLYVTTCVLAITLGLLIYFINIKLNKNHNISFLITIGTIYCLKHFIAARAQLVTYLLFVLAIFFIEMFIKKKNILYAIGLIVISWLIANLHCAVWPFYFVLFMPYIADWACTGIATYDYENHIKKFFLRFKKKKLGKDEYIKQRETLKEKIMEHDKLVESRFCKTNKIELERKKNAKWLIVIMIICAFMGLCTPIKDVPYTYLIKTMQGNTTESISEHQPLVLVSHENMIIILILVFGTLIFSRAKIRLCDFYMLLGLIALSFFSQRQISMLVLIGNFILVRLFCKVIRNIKGLFKVDESSKEELKLLVNVFMIAIIFSMSAIAAYEGKTKKNDPFVDETSYPVAAAEYINRELIPVWGKEKLRLYNEYNYGSYLLFQGIPVFIDSRADLYAPEFNGQKNESGKYEGNDIFSDFMGVNSLSMDYEEKFSEYRITHVITCENSKLSSLLNKDTNYSLIYSDEYFKIYERVRNVYEQD